MFKKAPPELDPNPFRRRLCFSEKRLFAVSDSPLESLCGALDNLFAYAERKTDVTGTAEAASGNRKNPFFNQFFDELAFIRERGTREEVEGTARHRVFDSGVVQHLRHGGAALAVNIQIYLRINAGFQNLLCNGRRIHITENTRCQSHRTDQFFRAGHRGVHCDIADAFSREREIFGVGTDHHAVRIDGEERRNFDIVEIQETVRLIGNQADFRVVFACGFRETRTENIQLAA